jgi:hypothetical protein
MCYPKGIEGDAKCSYCTGLIGTSPIDAQCRIEVNVLIPYIGPEFVAALLEHKNTATAAIDLRTDSKVPSENSLPAPRSKSAVNEKVVHLPLRREASRLRFSRLFAAVRGLVITWLP